MRAPIYFDWPGKVWLYSDPHFGDSGILKYERTEFKTTNEHDEFILNIINKTVNEGDTLVCLGDLGHGWERSIDKIKPGVKKILVLGNHDRLSKQHYKRYFDEIYDGPLFINKFIVLSHEPIPVSDHFINIHGHLHSSYLDSKNHINISIKMNNYKLCDIDRIYTNEISDRPRINARFLKEWYADLYIFTDTLKSDVFMYKDTGHVIPANVISNIHKNTNNELVEFMKIKEAKACNLLSTDNLDALIAKIRDGYKEFLKECRYNE